MMIKNYLVTAALALTALAGTAQTVSTTYNFTGGMQTFTVPCGVDTLFLQTWGAQGGDGAAGNSGAGPTAGGSGGLGGYAEGWLLVNQGDVLNIFVGGQGATPTGGFNGGGNGGSQNAGGGGGASDIRINGTAESDRIITAGGGGGGGRGGCESGTTIVGGNGGAGNSGNGGNGIDAPTSGGAAGGGFGAIGAAGGGAGIGCGGFLGQPGATATTGTGAAGGAGQSCCCFSFGSIPGGGGGGGGQVGGGGGGGGSAGTTGCSGNDKGAGGGGAGGSEYVGGVINGTTTAGIWLGNGQVTISYEDPTPSGASISAASVVMCANGQDTLMFMTPTDPEANYYTWTVDAGLNFIGGQNTNMISVSSLAAGTFMIYAVANDSVCGLTGAADSIMVTVNPTPSFTASANIDTFCIGGSSSLMASDSSNTYSWNPGSLSGQNVSVTPTATTTYTAVATDINGCTSSSTVEIVVNPLPVVTLSSVGSSCLNDAAVTLNGSPSGGTYSGPGVSGSNFTPATAGAGTHAISYVYTDVNGCTDSAATTATVNALPVVTLGTFTAVCVDDANVALTSGSPAGGTYSGPGVSGASLDPTTAGAGTHTIVYSYTDSSGCTASDSSTIVVNACVGINEIFMSSIVIAPNPAVDVLNLSWDANASVTAIRIMDVTGKVVMTQSVSGSNRATVDVAGLSAGNYSVSIEGADAKATLTFVKQ